MFKWFKRNKWNVTVGTLVVVLAMVATGILPGIPLKVGKTTVNLGEVQVVEAAGGTLDYYFTGVNDNTQFNAAIAALPATGGELTILSPAVGQSTINFSGTVTVPANVSIIGAGTGTSIAYNGVTACFASTNSTSFFSNLKMDAGGISGTYTASNIYIGATYYATVGTGTASFGSLTGTSATITTLSATTANLTTLNAPTGRTASYVIANTTYGSTLEKSQADLITTDGNAAITAALASFPTYTFTQPSTGTTYTGVQGTIVFGEGRYTFASQVNIPAGDNITIIGVNPTSALVGYYGNPRTYQGGTEFYFTGSTYPVFNMPLSTEGYPANPLSLSNIVFIVKNPAALQSNATWAFNLDGWASGTFNNVYFLTDVATFSLVGNPYSTGNIKGVSIQCGYDHDRLLITGMTVFGFASNQCVIQADHLDIQSLTIGGDGWSNITSGDEGYALKILGQDSTNRSNTIQIDQLHILWCIRGLYAPSTNLGEINITSMDTEYVGAQYIYGGGAVVVQDFQFRGNGVTTDGIDSTLFQNASIHHISYCNLASSLNWGGNVNSLQGIGLGSVNYINQLFPLLGDVRLLMPLYATSGTTVKDWSAYANNGTASADLSAWTIQPRIKGSSQVYFTNCSPTSDTISVPNASNLNFTTGSADQPFSLSVVINPSSVGGYVQCLIDKTNGSSLQEYNLDVLTNGVISFGIEDNTNGGWLGVRSSSGAVANGNWYVITATYDGSATQAGMHIYINGVENDATSNSGGSYTCMRILATLPVTIGKKTGGGEFIGAMSYPIITGTLLTAQTVRNVTNILDLALGLPTITY